MVRVYTLFPPIVRYTQKRIKILQIDSKEQGGDHEKLLDHRDY